MIELILMNVNCAICNDQPIGKYDKDTMAILAKDGSVEISGFEGSASKIHLTGKCKAQPILKEVFPLRNWQNTEVDSCKDFLNVRQMAALLCERWLEDLMEKLNIAKTSFAEIPTADKQVYRNCGKSIHVNHQDLCCIEAKGGKSHKRHNNIRNMPGNAIRSLRE